MKIKINKIVKIAFFCVIISWSGIAAARFPGTLITPDNHVVNESDPVNEVNLTGPNVVFFNVSGMIPIENKSRFILQGEKYGTACRYNI